MIIWNPNSIGDININVNSNGSVIPVNMEAANPANINALTLFLFLSLAHLIIARPAAGNANITDII